MQGSKQEVTKLSPFGKKVEKLGLYPSTLNNMGNYNHCSKCLNKIKSVSLNASVSHTVFIIRKLVLQLICQLHMHLPD